MFTSFLTPCFVAQASLPTQYPTSSSCVMRLQYSPPYLSGVCFNSMIFGNDYPEVFFIHVSKFKSHIFRFSEKIVVKSWPSCYVTVSFCLFVFTFFEIGFPCLSLMSLILVYRLGLSFQRSVSHLCGILSMCPKTWLYKPGLTSNLQR